MIRLLLLLRRLLLAEQVRSLRFCLCDMSFMLLLLLRQYRAVAV